MIDVADYDKFNYDYSSYWKQREYENLAEKNILNKIFSTKRGHWLLDVGGSYGRLASTYYNQYDKPIILDYSLKTLQKNKEIIENKYPNIILIAANAYKMPFKQGVFDAAIMIRVLHHIQNPEIYLKALKMVMKSDSTYIQEYANKKHIKAIIKSLIKLNFDIFSEAPYQQPQLNNLEGSEEKQESIFLNYHPKYIKKTFKKYGFQIYQKYGCSFLRSPLIKSLINIDVLMFFEIMAQNLLSWTNISPSIILETKVKKNKENIPTESNKLKDILLCPYCKGNLDFPEKETALCKKCSKTYLQKEGIWDFRVN